MSENKFIKKDKSELNEQLEGIWEFIKKIHPELRNSKYSNKLLREINIAPSDLAIELRALRRDVEGNPMYCNHRVYNYGDKQKQSLEQFLKKLNDKEIPYCLYYSTYCFNSNVLAVSQSGNIAKEWNNRIALNNAVGTHILIWDFDHIDENEFIQIKCKLLRMGLETLDVFTGHGYQSIILLNDLSLDKELLKEFTVGLWERGFDVDLKIKDCARIMRNPDGFNSKDVLSGGEMIPTYIYSDIDKRYALEDVRRILNSTPKIRECKSIDKPKKECKTEIKVENKPMEAIKEIKEVNGLNKNRLNDRELEKLYPMLNIDKLEDAVKLMLSGFQNGRANNMLMFIVLYLKEQGYAKSIIVDVVNILKDLDTYNYSWSYLDTNIEVSRFYFNNKYTSKTIFLSELQDFGYIEYVLNNNEVITINNYIFTKLADMSSSAFYIYSKLLEKEHSNNTSVYTANEIADIAGVTRRCINKHINDLVKAKLLDKKRANRRNNEEYTFYLSKFEQHRELGYTKFNVGSFKLLTRMVKYKELTTTQLVICMYIKYVCYNGKQNCCISQNTLSSVIGISQSGISKAFKSVEDTELIKRDKVEINDFQFKYNYTINY